MSIILLLGTELRPAKGICYSFSLINKILWVARKGEIKEATIWFVKGLQIAGGRRLLLAQVPLGRCRRALHGRGQDPAPCAHVSISDCAASGAAGGHTRIPQRCPEKKCLSQNNN